MSNILYQVPARFDGRQLHPAQSQQGEPVQIAALDADGDGSFNIQKDVVLLAHHGTGDITRSDLESVATPQGLAALSATGARQLTEEDLAQAGLHFAFDRDGDGAIELNRSGLTRGMAKLRNALGEGAVTYNGDEKISVQGKQQAGASYFKDYRATLDLDHNHFQEEFVFNQQSYDQYSSHMDRTRLGFGAASAVGFGLFLVAKNAVSPHPALVIAGVLGLAVGGMCALAATMSKQLPDLPVRY